MRLALQFGTSAPTAQVAPPVLNLFFGFRTYVALQFRPAKQSWHLSSKLTQNLAAQFRRVNQTWHLSSKLTQNLAAQFRPEKQTWRCACTLAQKPALPHRSKRTLWHPYPTHEKHMIFEFLLELRQPRAENPRLQKVSPKRLQTSHQNQ